MASKTMSNSNYVHTGLKGKNWQSQLNELRADWLRKEMKNGGRMLTFDQLREKLAKELPGGRPIAEKHLQRAAFASWSGKDFRSWDELMSVKMPSRTAPFLKEREEQRLQLLEQHKEERQQRKSHKETSVSHLRSAGSGSVPKEMLKALENVRDMMLEHGYEKLEMSVSADGTTPVSLTPKAAPVNVTL